MYCRLTREDRYQIQALDRSGTAVRAIARQIKRSPSTVLRELRRGRFKGVYDASFSEDACQAYRHRPLLVRRKIRGTLECFIKRKLRMDWSPDEITEDRRLRNEPTVSAPTIYRYLERDKLQQGRLWKHLRILRRKHKNRKRPLWNRRIFLPNRIPIEQRPRIVEARSRIGDFERDTVLGKRGGSALLTIVDRTSRLLKLAWIPKNTAENVHRATVRLLRHEPVYTITNDNGFEFMFHHKTSKRLKAEIYFSNAFRSWERGTNENTNGLLRQYFPKKQDIGLVSPQRIKAIERRLNTRPRKVLGYRTPIEIHSALKASGVALAT